MTEQRNEALLLRSMPYSDSSLIIHVLTKDHGRISLMARGARRIKSPFRAGLMPLYQLNIRWREPRTGSMGTLIEIQRLSPLLSEFKILAGQELLATASTLFPDGTTQGYSELLHACNLLSERPEDSGLCVAIWNMLETSGWIGDFEHCWHCVEEVSSQENMYWKQGHLLCKSCASNHGALLSPGFRKSIMGHMSAPYIKLTQQHITLWNIMIKDIIRTHSSKSYTS